MSKPIIYAAGRMDERFRKRFGITNNVINSSDVNLFTPSGAHIIDCEHAGYAYRYAGPYAGSCDHGCSHSPALTWSMPNVRGSSTHAMSMGGCFCPGQDWTPEDTFLRSLDGIAKAEYVFAWIQDTQCYGTLVEIGHARALGKPIYVAHHPDISPHGDLWFSMAAATAIRCFADARTAYSEFIKQVGLPIRAAR